MLKTKHLLIMWLQGQSGILQAYTKINMIFSPHVIYTDGTARLNYWLAIQDTAKKLTSGPLDVFTLK